MIFVTVGTEKFPFDRLVRCVDLAVGEGKIMEEVFIQKGHSSYVPQYAKYTEFLGFPRMMDMLQRSRVVVSHAGVGSFLLCIQLGKVPILVPRRATLGEHLDDHQLEFAKVIELLNKAIVTYDEKQVLEKLHWYPKLAAKVALSLSPGRKRLLSHLEAIL